MESLEIDWSLIAQRLNLLYEDGEGSSSSAAEKALDIIIGEKVLKSAVDHYISRDTGAELARSVLGKLHSWTAMNYCYEIYKNSSCIEVKCTAVELLKAVGDRRILHWIPEFLNDPDNGVQNWAICIVDQFVFSGLIWPEEAEILLVEAEKIPNLYVHEKIEEIRAVIHRRLSRNFM